MRNFIFSIFLLIVSSQLFAQNGFVTFEPILKDTPRNQSQTSTKYKQTCIVQYLNEEGWSKKYSVDVTFISGMRLNEATKSLKYSYTSKYALIFWGEGQASIIKLSTLLPCGEDIYMDCVTNIVGGIRGRDQDEREWKICVTDFC